ncbi:MAG: hypothetical protein OHK0046_10280 [Anaerolineae bacterium]
MSELSALEISDADLVGSIPAELGSLSNLVILDLSKNLLTGPIPTAFSALTQLEILYLNDNTLTGEIPAELGSLPQLSELRLGNNDLTGEIPAELGSLPQLSELWLGNNDLTGEIPSDFANVVFFELQLQNNRLGGEIPSGLEGFYVDISSNKFQGELPTDFNFDVVVLDAAYNMLLLTGPDALTQTIPPTNLAASNVTATTAQISWTPILYTADGGYYEVGYSRSAGGPYTPAVQTTDKTIAQGTLTGLSPQTTYYAAVRTFTPAHANNKNALLTDWSDEISFVTGGDDPAVDTPTPTATNTPTVTATPAITGTPSTETSTPTATQSTPSTPTSTATTTPLPGLYRIAPAANAVIDEGSEYVSKFQWVAVPGAAWYHVFVSSPDFSQIFFDKWYQAADVCNGNVCTTTDDLWLVGNGEFSWWMTYWNESIGADYADLYEESRFTLNLPLPEKVTGSASSNGVVTWNADPNALWYHIWVGPADYSATSYLQWHNGAEVCAGSACSVTVNGLSAGDYEFWAQTWNPAGVTDWHKVADFTVGS